MSDTSRPAWAFLTNHAQVLICIARDPDVRLRDIGGRVGITERAAHRIVVELAESGYISRERTGRRNRYMVHADVTLRDPILHEQSARELLGILARSPDGEREAHRARASA